MKRFLLSAVFVLLWPWQMAWAYNFLYIHPTEGRPIGWEKGTIIRYYLDPGPLGQLTNDQAHILLKEAMKIWENASPYADVPHFEFAGYLPEDVDGTNYQKSVSLGSCYTAELESCPTETQRNLQTVMVWDDGDSILDNELCQIRGCSAAAGARVFSGSSQNPGNIVAGVAVFGSGVVPARFPEGVSLIVGTMIHELGHLLGLAHTVVSQQIAIESIRNASFSLPTMMAYDLNGEDEATLNPDDVVGVINLYPNDTASLELGTIKGEILKSDGSPMMHVNVIARNIEDPLCEAYSWLSGRVCPEEFHTPGGLLSESCIDSQGNVTPIGTFSVQALPPASYTLEVEEVADEDLAFTLAPGLVDPFIYGDAEFWNEGDQSNESYTLSSPITLEAGQTVEGINIVLNDSAVDSDRIRFIPWEYYSQGPASSCPSSSVNYASLAGIEDPSEGGSSEMDVAGCSLIP